MKPYRHRSGRPLRRPILVIVSGAPGSGKTTMGARLAEELRLPHLNRDLVRDGLWMTDGDDAAVATDRSWRVWLAAVRRYLEEGVSVVIDQTFYRGLSDVTLRSELVPLAWAVNVHLMAANATERWCARIDRDDRWGPDPAAALERVHRIQDQVRDPLDFGCPQLVVDTTDPDVPIEPLAREIWDLVVAQDAPGSAGADDGAVLRDLDLELGGKWFHLVTRLDRRPPPAANISTAHCLAFDGEDLVLALHTSRDWTIPGGHLEPGESAEDAMHREALEEAGITVTDPILFAHEEIDPHDGVAADPKYAVPAYQVFYVARLATRGPITARDECTDARLFPPEAVRRVDGWPQRNLPLYEAALEIARRQWGPPGA